MSGLHGIVCSTWSKPSASDETKDRVFFRRPVEGRCRVDKTGLAPDISFPKLERAKKVSKDPSERAVLIQTKKHYQELRQHFPSCESTFNGEDAEFGENLIVDGLDATTVCIGDVFSSDQSGLLLQVTFPRLACIRPDKRHPMGLPTGKPGTVRQWVSANSRGGFFARVLKAGDIDVGDVLQLTRRSQPTWSLARTASLCYPTTPLQVTWGGTQDELLELAQLPELGEYEWKERLHVILGWSDNNCCRASVPTNPNSTGEEISAEARSGDGTIANVGIKLDGEYQCPHCSQKFLSERALSKHFKFVHDPNRHQED